MNQVTSSYQNRQGNSQDVVRSQRPVKPKRPMSAYNYFFQFERKRLLDALPVRPEGKPRRSHGKLGFRDMAKTIGARWNAATEETRAYYARFAEEDRERYNQEKKIYDLQRQNYQKNDDKSEQPSSAMSSPLTSKFTPSPTDWEPLSPFTAGIWDPEMSQMLGSIFLRAKPK